MAKENGTQQMQKLKKRAPNAAPTSRTRFRLGSAPTLAQSQHQKLRGRILSMELPPGAPISETDLAEQSGVSRTPVREAILMLAKENLVEVVPKSGTFVARIPISALPEALIARRALEGMTARAAAKFASRSQVLGLYALLEQQRELSGQDDIANFRKDNEQP
ncbi:MAG: GntR family transcriptional regulator [Rhodobacteraceae bacterium]|nr:GntR family transcriptional regulator [Paracoccaceae bacterium]